MQTQIFNGGYILSLKDLNKTKTMQMLYMKKWV